MTEGSVICQLAGSVGKPYAEHDRGYVAQMLSCGREADDCKDSAQCRAVELGSGNDHKQCGEGAVDGILINEAPRPSSAK